MTCRGPSKAAAPPLGAQVGGSVLGADRSKLGPGLGTGASRRGGRGPGAPPGAGGRVTAGPRERAEHLVVPGVYRCVCCSVSLNIQFRSALSRILHQHTAKPVFHRKWASDRVSLLQFRPGRLASCHVLWTDRGSHGRGARLANACPLGRPRVELGPSRFVILPSPGSASLSAEVRVGNGL